MAVAKGILVRNLNTIAHRPTLQTIFAMKTDTAFPFLFNPETSVVGTWSAPSQSKRRTAPRSLPIRFETQIGCKQETICGVILVLCALFSLAAFVARFTLA